MINNNAKDVALARNVQHVTHLYSVDDFSNVIELKAALQPCLSAESPMFLSEVHASSLWDLEHG